MSGPFDTPAAARRWLLEDALPLWWQVGADRENGGWFDRVDQAGQPVAVPKRARVQARQAFVYAEAAKLGWGGPAAEAVAQGVDFLRRAYRRDDGFYRKTVRPEGAPADDGFDLYDQAFALLAFASGYETLGRPDELKREAVALVETLDARLAHPAFGYQEAFTPRPPLRSNPHMHLLEALLAWVALDGGDLFAERAAGIVRLAEAHLIDPATGAVGEYYELDWSFQQGVAGGVREQGHQFEWSFLLGHADALLGGDHAAMSAALYRFGATHGVDAERRVAIFSTDAKGRPLDVEARLWAQTERLRAAAVQGDAAAVDESLATLSRFCDVPVRGLWLDRMRADGSLVEEAAPASSFYHIVTGLLPVIG